MTENIMNSKSSIHDIPDKFLVKILQKLKPLEQHEAAMVNKKWFDCIYKNPKNLEVLSLIFGNVLLDDLEPPLCYFIESKIPYKRLVIGHNIRLGSVENFCAKIGETLEELVIKDSVLKKKFEKELLTAGRIADILEHMKQLKVLEINWMYQNEFMGGSTLFQRQNGEKVEKALQNVKEFRLIARDVTSKQFISLVLAFKNLESLFVKIQYSSYFYQANYNTLTDWETVLHVVKQHASTLRHLFVDLRTADSQTELPVNKGEVLEKLRGIRDLQLESFSIDLIHDFNTSFLCQVFKKFTHTLTTLGPAPKHHNIIPAMQITPSNLNWLVKILPNLQHINVEISRGYIKDMTIFQHLSDLHSLNLNVNRFERNHHVFHRNSHDPIFQRPPLYPKLDQLKITGPSTPNANRHTCIKCIVYMSEICPNITRLELNVHESIDDQGMRLIFHFFVHLEVLAVTSCNGLTDNAFTGTYIKQCGPNIIKRVQESFSIGHLKHLHTLLLYPLELITDASFVDGFAKLPNLKRIAINGLNNITEVGIEALVEGCPQLEVVYFEDCVEFDEHFIKFMIDRLINLKYLRLGGIYNLHNDLPCINGLEFMQGNPETRTVIWKAHNAYKLAKCPLPMNVLDLELV